MRLAKVGYCSVPAIFTCGQAIPFFCSSSIPKVLSKKGEAAAWLSRVLQRGGGPSSHFCCIIFNFIYICIILQLYGEKYDLQP